MKKRILFCVTALVCIALVACGAGDKELLFGKKNARPTAVKSTETQLVTPAEGAQTATIITSLGNISIVLYPQYAPMAVENFVGLVAQGYYNNVSFHRVIAGFMVQTGDNTGTGVGGTSIWNGNVFPVELCDALHHYAGAVGVAHQGDSTTGNLSQFYIVQTPMGSIDNKSAKTLTEAGVREGVVSAYQEVGGAPYLDNLNTVFAQVYAGMDVVDAIGAVKCDENDKPLEDVLVIGIELGNYSAAAAAPSSAAP